MTNRYDNNSQRGYDDGRMNRRQGNGAYEQQNVSARQRFADQQAQGQVSRGRLHHDEMIRDHGQNARQTRRSASEFDRERFSERSRNQEQMRRQAQAQQQAQSRNGGQRPAQGGRRQAYLDQSGQVPRYTPGETGAWRQQDTRQRKQDMGYLQQQPYDNMVDRYSRGNAMYQARPDAGTQAAKAASAAQGFLSTPFSFLVRIALIVVLVLVFGVRMALSSGPTAQLAEVNNQIASQQEQLDTLNTENEQMQENIDSRQSTLDAYNAIVQASS